MVDRGLAHAYTITPEPKQVFGSPLDLEFATRGIIGIHPYRSATRRLFTSIATVSDRELDDGQIFEYWDC